MYCYYQKLGIFTLFLQTTEITQGFDNVECALHTATQHSKLSKC